MNTLYYNSELDKMPAWTHNISTMTHLQVTDRKLLSACLVTDFDTHLQTRPELCLLSSAQSSVGYS
jgi:hypothetical protein